MGRRWRGAFTPALTPWFTAGFTVVTGFRSDPPAAHTTGMDDIEPVDVTVVGDGGTGRDVTVRLRDAAATVGELAVALGWSDAPLAIDGVDVAATAPVVTSGLRRGSVVTVRRPPTRSPHRVAAVLRWTGGVDAGRSVALAAGTTVIGRARDAHVRCRDLRVAPYECLVHVGAGSRRVEPLVGAAAPPPGSRWRIGARQAELAEPDDHRVARRPDPTPPGRWTVPFHRPPRPSLAAAPPPVRAPRLVAPASRTALGGAGPVAALIAAAGSVIAAVALGQPAFLLLGGLGAAGSLVSWVLQHRAGRRAARAGRRRDRIALASFAAAVAAQTEAVMGARWERALELPAAVARAGAGDARLWERRPHHHDFLELVLGVGTVPWVPEVDGLDEEPAAGIVTALAQHDRLIDVPVAVALRPGTVLGLVGDVDAARALARSLVVQLAVSSGPADLSIVVDATTVGWEWTRWLPHVDGDAVAAQVVIVDGAGPAARLDGAAGIVLAPDVLALPSCCTHVVTVGPDADLSLLDLATGVMVDGVVGAGASVATAAGVARALARYDDPELLRPGGDLPRAVDLSRLLGPGALDGEAVAAAWAALPADPPLRAPIGLDGDGPVELDLVDDGPHALVAGTTGSGKSELLRTLVTGLAARCRPEHLAFVLVDYKGGSAFDACAALPHVAAVVTDLDGRLAARALRSLEAELRHRERLLRNAGASDIVAFRRAGGRLPRLVIVVDEMAGLAAELPDFVPALVGVAQRGRSLGLHLVLATQRPAGVVTDDIRANTNLRVALRMQTAAESHDVLGRADAAELPRDRPGRAVLRRGPDDVTVVQVAHSGGEARPVDRPAVEVRPVGAGPAASDRNATGGPTTLARLVDALGDAARRLALTPVAPPWPPALPSALALDDLAPGAVALADDPDHQAQHSVSWSDGNLLCVGVAGSGTSTALASLAVALAAAVPPADRHLYMVDMDSGGLAALAALPHAAVVTAADRERQARLVRRLQAEVEHRRAGPPGEGAPEIVLLVDGLPALRAAFDDPAGFAVLDALDQVITGGAGLGVRVAATADRAGALPVAVLAGFGRRWTFRAFDGPPLPPGRAVDGDTGWELQVATASRPRSDAAADVGRRWPPDGGPAPIGVLPTDLVATALPPPTLGLDRWTIPVGIADTDLQPAGLVLHPGDHVFIGGRSRTGRSSALVLLGQRLRAGAPPDLLVAALALRPSPLRDAGAELVVTDPAGLPALGVLGAARRPAILLVDDAERVDDDGTLAGLAAAGSRLHIVAAGRPDVLRSLYGHWTAALRRSRLGVLLQPDVDVDGDLLGTVLPRRPAMATVAPVPGRGYLVVDGRPELVQLAAPANMDA